MYLRLPAILGFPADTPELIERDIKVVQKELPIDIVEFFILTPLPGSADHKELYEKGVWMSSGSQGHSQKKKETVEGSDSFPRGRDGECSEVRVLLIVQIPVDRAGVIEPVVTSLGEQFSSDEEKDVFSKA